jgi:hypothetical protein
VKLRVADCAGLEESVAATWKVNAPPDVGAPLTIPLEEFSASPGGKAPLARLKLTGGQPPLVAMLCWYESPATPFASAAVVMASGGGAAGGTETAPPLGPPPPPQAATSTARGKSRRARGRAVAIFSAAGLTR